MGQGPAAANELAIAALSLPVSDGLLGGSAPRFSEGGSITTPSTTTGVSRGSILFSY